jgi:hypothetical protein
MAVEETIKIKIQANAEEFKIVSDIINRELGRLGKNFEVLEGNIKQSSNAMKGFDGSSKKFNKGLMSISLILQDLPYGFRGIQNNIPALVQGMGLVYLAISAVTAAMTYFVLQGDKMSKSTKAMYDSFKDFINGAASALYSELKPVFESIVSSLTELWKMFGEFLTESYSSAWKLVISITKNIGQIIAGLFKVIVAVLKGDWQGLGTALVDILKRASNLIVDVLIHIFSLVDNFKAAVIGLFSKDMANVIKAQTKGTAESFAKTFKFAFAETKKETIDLFSLFGSKTKDAEVTISDFAKTMNRFNEEIKKISILFLEFRQMSELDYLEGQIKALNVAIDDLAGQSTDEAIKKLEELIQLRGELLLTQRLAEAQQNIGGDIEVIKETETKPVFDKNQFKAGKEVMETWFDSIRKKFKEMQKLAKESQEYLLKIGVGMMSALGPALDMLLEKGSSIGDVLSTAFSDLIKKLAKVAIAAAIVVALMALIGLVDLSQIGKTFGMLVGQGMGMGAGLFSGPTSGTSAISPSASSSIGDLTAATAMQNETLIAQVSGNDLLVLLNRTSRTNNNTF